MGDKVVTESSKTEHLGILRILRSSKEENAINILKRTSLARRTLNSLIKTGVHGCNGLNAKIAYKIYQVYVIPRLLYGLEVLLLNKGQLDHCLSFYFGEIPHRNPEEHTVITYKNSKFHCVSTTGSTPFKS